MEPQEFSATLAQLREAASKLQVGLERGGLTLTPGQVRTLNGVTRGLHRSVMAHAGSPATDRARLVERRDALIPRVVARLPGWRLRCQLDDGARPTLGLTRKTPLGPLTGAGLYGPDLPDLERAALLLENEFASSMSPEIERAA